MEPATTTVKIHNVDHRVGIHSVLLKDPNNPEAPVVIPLEAHERNLMDPIPSPPELEAVEKDPLDDKTQEKLPDVTKNG